MLHTPTSLQAVHVPPCRLLIPPSLGYFPPHTLISLSHISAPHVQVEHLKSIGVRADMISSVSPPNHALQVPRRCDAKGEKRERRGDRNARGERCRGERNARGEESKMPEEGRENSQRRKTQGREKRQRRGEQKTS